MQTGETYEISSPKKVIGENVLSNFGISGVHKFHQKKPRKECSRVDKFLSHGGLKLIILKMLYMDTGNEQLSKCMADGGSQVFHCWSVNLQISQRSRLE